MWCHDCLRRTGARKWEENFPHLNWAIILSIQLLISSNHGILNPSLYQYITTPKTLAPSEPNATESSVKFWPGLGESKIIYAWAITAFSTGEVVAAPFAALLIQSFPYIISPLVASLLYIIGGVIYALANHGWMVIVGRFVSGFACTISAVLQTSYIGEMGTKVDQVRKRRGKKYFIKDILYITYSFVINIGFFLSYALTLVMAQFPDVNPYRWPGWFLAACGAAYGVLVLTAFRETKPIAIVKCKCLSCNGMVSSWKFSSKWKIDLLVYICLGTCCYVIGSCYALLYTLINPALSDKFGFSVSSISFFYVGISLIFLSTTFIQILLKIIKVDNRLFLIIAVLLGLLGSILIGDWQGIGHNPCSLTNIIGPFNTSTNGSGLEDNDYSQSGMFSAGSALNSDSIYSLPLSDGISFSSNSSLHNWVESCEALSSSSHQCFWNPKSRITGEFCNTCHTACYSEQQSLNFYQFSLGVSLISLCAALGFVFMSVVISGYGTMKQQGTLLSLGIGLCALGRAISPLWLVETYEITEKHTILSMTIFGSCLGVVLLFLIGLYRKLAPQSSHQQNSYYIDATLPLKTKDIEGIGQLDATKYDKSQNIMEKLSVSTFTSDSRIILLKQESITAETLKENLQKLPPEVVAFVIEESTTNQEVSLENITTV